jgi:hypothetical protein
MTARIPQNVSTWLVDGSIVTTTGNTMIVARTTSELTGRRSSSRR